MKEIKKVIIEGNETKPLKSSEIVMAPPVSVFSLRPFHRIYQSMLSNQTNQSQKDILFIPDKHEHYWQCSCGERQIDTFNTCQGCGISKDILFKKDVPYELAVFKIRHLVF